MGLCGSTSKSSANSKPPENYKLEGGVIAPPSWTAPQPITRAQLQKNRDEFWETQPAYGGSPEIWASLRGAIEQPEVREAILEASEIRLPSRSWAEVYDTRGFKYELPVYVLSDPTNIIVEGGGGAPPMAGPPPPAA